MTAAVLHVMQGRRSTSFGKPQKQVKPAKGRLANLAPRYQVSSDPDALDKVDLNLNTSVNVPRTRLPPRSRFGCWTCRTRKVKCDEARPECTPCARLGHTCDYNPRLSFKDDTPRVVEKMSAAFGVSGPVWQPSAKPWKRQRLSPPQDDHLPPFSLLTNDDDRERKAEFRKPGTYNVVVNPASFAELEEYKDTYEDSYPRSPSRRLGSVQSDQFGSDFGHYNDPLCASTGGPEIVDDPDVVILKVFEDDSRKVVVSPAGPAVNQRIGRASRTPTISSTSSSTSRARPDYFKFSSENTPLMRMAAQDGRDHQLVYYYKTFVHRHLAQVHRDSLGTSMETGVLSAPDVFEKHAANFLPLYHALMAFSALSMSHDQPGTNLDALQHYQKALPSLQASLRSDQDLASDGVFMTHFILLLYEIAAGEPRGLSLWSQHISQLLRIILLRREMYENEPYSFIIWWVASIDTHVVLSGMGNGEFVEQMLRHNLLPTGIGSDAHYHPSRRPLSPDPHQALPSALSFHRRISILAAELGLLARDLRKEAKKYNNLPSVAVVRGWTERICVIQDTLRRAWNVQMPASIASGYCNQILPVGARGIFEHSFALYRALIIYSHTSMYPTQRSHNPSHYIHEVSQCGGEILRLGREIVSTQHLERKFVVFPLFMSAFVSKSRDDREETLELIRKLEQDSVGRNVIAARQLLEIVFERQEQRRQELRFLRGVQEGRAEGWGGQMGQGWEEAEDVDWVGMIGELGLQVVNFRL